MTEADKYWQKKVTSNQALAKSDTRVTISAAVLEKEIRKAFKAGQDEGFKRGHRVGKLSKLSDDEKNSLDTLFEQFREIKR